MSEICYRAVTEETLLIDLPSAGGLKIKGILRGEFTQPLIVMMHGRPGSGNELLQYLGARYLHEQGFASLRLFMYDFEPNTRNLLDCTLQTHADDFDAVIDYLRGQKVPKVFAVGHSYGGLTILRSKSKLDGAVLWDPTHGLVWHGDQSWKKDLLEEEYKKIIIMLSGYGCILPKAMREEDYAFGDNSSWATHKGYPLKLIAAGKGAMVDLGQKYIAAADESKQFIKIPDAHHQFEDSDEVVLRLFEETSGWFKEIIDGKLC